MGKLKKEYSSEKEASAIALIEKFTEAKEKIIENAFAANPDFLQDKDPARVDYQFTTDAILEILTNDDPVVEESLSAFEKELSDTYGNYEKVIETLLLENEIIKLPNEKQESQKLQKSQKLSQQRMALWEPMGLWSSDSTNGSESSELSAKEIENKKEIIESLENAFKLAENAFKAEYPKAFEIVDLLKKELKEKNDKHREVKEELTAFDATEKIIKQQDSKQDKDTERLEKLKTLRIEMQDIETSQREAIQKVKMELQKKIKPVIEDIAERMSKNVSSFLNHPPAIIKRLRIFKCYIPEDMTQTLTAFFKEREMDALTSNGAIASSELVVRPTF